MDVISAFFTRKEGNVLELFGPLHLGITFGFALVYALIIIFREKLRKTGNLRRQGKVFAIILFVNMAVHYVSRVAAGIWTFSEDLPLHLCFVTNFFMIYVLWTGNRHGLYGLVYYFTLIGPLPAMIWPDIRALFDSWIFYQFLISHHLMLGFSVYSLAVFEYKTSFKHAALSFGIGNAYVALMALFNSVFGTNYVMLYELPAHLYDVYPFLDVMPPAYWLELVGIISIGAAFGISQLVNYLNSGSGRKRRRNSRTKMCKRDYPQ